MEVTADTENDKAVDGIGDVMRPEQDGSVCRYPFLLTLAPLHAAPSVIRLGKTALDLLRAFMRCVQKAL